MFYMLWSNGCMFCMLWLYKNKWNNGCMFCMLWFVFCMLLFNFVYYVFFLSCLCILIVMYIPF
jgi:hypothetical protein